MTWAEGARPVLRIARVYGRRESPEKAHRLREKVVEETGKFTNRIEKFVDDSCSGKKRDATSKEIGIGVYYFEN